MQQQPDIARRPLDLARHTPRLASLQRALFDLSPTLLPVDQNLTTRRPFLSNLGLHLPSTDRAQLGTQMQHWYDAAALHASAHLQHSGHKYARGGLKPIQCALLGLLEDARVELLAAQTMPGLRRLWLGFHHAEPTHGTSFVVLMRRLARVLLDPAHADPHPWVAKARTLFMDATAGGQAPQALAPAALRGMASLLGNDIGQMRLQFNARDHLVEPDYRDDNAWIWLPPDTAPAQVRAVADAVTPPTQRGNAADDQDGEAEACPAPRPVVGSTDAAATPAVAQWHYPEWDRLMGDYRNAWCTVVEHRPLVSDPRPMQACVERSHTLLLRMQRVLQAAGLRERVMLRAQSSGETLDLDAALRSAIERRSRHPPAQRVYQRQVRRARSVSALLLLDSSASTADLVPPHGGEPGGDSVLDLARRAALLTAMALRQAGDRCAIDAFCSNGRHEVRYTPALAFDAALDAAALSRLAGLGSQLSTRMGAALRHAAAKLAQQPQRQRLLLLITDGAPHDIDVHDRRYLVEDARRAVLETRRLGVAVFCVTLGAQADSAVQHIFGRAHCRVLDHLHNLPRILPAMVLRLTR